jgi:hypothetical protein
MSDLRTILHRHGGSREAYYTALEEFFMEKPIYSDPITQELICGASELCDLLLRSREMRRPEISFARALTALQLDETDAAKLATITGAVDDILARSVLGDRAGVAPEWLAWFSELSKSEILERIAVSHLDQVVFGEPYDLAQLSRDYVSEVSCYLAGVDRTFSDSINGQISAAVEFMDGRADSLADALRAVAGIKSIADQVESTELDLWDHWQLNSDIPNRVVFLITAHESSAYLIVTACQMLKDQPDMEPREVVRAALDLDFPIQSMLRECREDTHLGSLQLYKGQRVRIHIGAAFGGGRYTNRSFGGGTNTCPGAKIASSMAEAFIRSFRPFLHTTRFLDGMPDRQTSIAARKFRSAFAITG